MPSARSPRPPAPPAQLRAGRSVWQPPPGGHAALLGLLLVLGGGCADETGDDGADAGDGRVHPPPNGVHIGESEACTALVDGVRDQAMALGCSTTLRPCPEFLRSQFTTPCLQYDEGSVAGCVAYYRSLGSCSELDPTACAVTAYPGTEPAGCPP